MITEAPRIIDSHGLGFGKNIILSVETPPPPLRAIPGDTARHEAKHGVAAIENGTAVESMSIIPGPGYLGITRLSRPDAVAALAPHATGESGTGHDVFIASLIGDAGAEGAARSIINSNADKVEAVAEVLERKKSIGSSDIYEAIDNIDKPLFKSATLIILTEEGERRKEVKVRDDNTVMVPGEWVELAKSA